MIEPPAAEKVSQYLILDVDGILATVASINNRLSDSVNHSGREIATLPFSRCGISADYG
jgi:hypothetical protein